MTMRWLMLACMLAAPGAWAAERPCGVSPTDWCPAPAGDPCGRHGTVAACRADAACRGLPYRGESLVRCERDARGFGLNCPTVGCVSAGR